MEEEIDDNDVLGEDYYSFLNISREATPEEITNAYRRLSRLYHPDKHVDPARKREAEVMFNKTKRAYEVLRDEHKRAIYDSVGIKGLETEGWEVMQRTKTPQEIREEYERLARQREERRLQQRTNPKGTVTININATDLFTTYDYDYEFEDVFPTIEVSGMSITQSIEAPLTTRDTATISGQLSTHNGNGNGGLTVSNRRSVSEKGWIEFIMGAGNGPLLACKGFATITKRVFSNAEAHLHFTPAGVRTAMDASLGMHLDRHTTGYMSWRGGGNTSGLSTTFARDSEGGYFTTTVLIGLPHSFITASYTWKLKERELKVRLAAKCGTFGSVLEYGAEKKVSEQSSVGAAVSVGVPSGVVLKVKMSRGSQIYNFAIQLCEEAAPSPVFYATVVPLLTWAVVKKLVIEPIANQRAEDKKQRHRTNYRNRMMEKRREAEAATNLMRVTFTRVRGEEEQRRGLVITVARYGRMARVSHEPDNNEDPETAEVIDVTVPLQCLVKDSKLVVHESTKSGLAGFYDPCPGEEKALFVQYLFHNQLHQTTVGDKEQLRIPRQTHRVMPT